MPDNLISTTGHRLGTRGWRGPLTRAAGVLIAVGLVAGSAASAGAATTAASASRTDVLRSVPRYYLALTPISKHSGRLDAVIHSTLTGAAVATIEPPRPFTTFSEATGAADSRTFILAAQPRVALTSDPAAFFRARFNPVTGKVQLTRLAIPEVPGSDLLTGLAITPNGTRLALAVLSGSEAKVMVYSLASGTVRTWQSQGTIGSDPDDYLAISWGRAGTLAVDWDGVIPGTGLRLLNTAGPAGSLLGHSRLAVATKQPGGYSFNWDGIIASDGRTLIVPMWRPRPNSKPGASQLEEEFQEFSVATGHMTRALWRVHTSSETVAWSNPSGRILLVVAPSRNSTSPGAKDVIGLLSGDHFTPLPGVPALDASYPTPVF
jgi:hypothetical protein